MIAAAIRLRLRQFFFNRAAILEADRRAAQLGDAGKIDCASARQLLATAMSLDEAPDRLEASIVLLRHAVLFAAQGLALRRRLIVDLGDPATTWHAIEELSEIRTVLAEFSCDTQRQIGEMVVSGVTAEVHTRSQDELRALRKSSIRVAQCVMAQLEGDILRPKTLRSHRFARWLAVVLATALLSGWAVQRVWHMRRSRVPHNLAYKKSVSISSNWQAATYPPQGLVDGNVLALGCHTVGEEQPWAQVDLGDEYTIQRVEVTNRLDGLTERAIGLVIEYSSDGSSFVEYARQTTDFRTWIASEKVVQARYVRVRLSRGGILHLNEVVVWGY